MIIVRTPLRISFVGGGSDLPVFYRQTAGAVLSATISKYIHLTIHPYFYPKQLLIKYSRTEKCRHPQRLKHPIFRSILSDLQLNGLEISSLGDVPGRTGLGSSSALAVALHHGLSALQGAPIVSKKFLAQKACQTELISLQEPIGKQDQYAAAYGGLNFIRFLPDEKVIVEPIKITKADRHELDQRLLLFYTGDTRSASQILSKQTQNIVNSPAVFRHLQQMVRQAFKAKVLLEKKDWNGFGRLLDQGWQLKKKMENSISNPRLDQYYRLATSPGKALGGKLLGAGGGGFFLFYCPSAHQDKLREALKDLRELPFQFSDQGSEVIFNNHATI